MLTPMLIHNGSDSIPDSLKNAVDELSDYSIPIYVYKKNSKLEQIGTGFILCRNNRRFLVTAGHCIRTILEYNRDPKHSAAIVLAFEEKTYVIDHPAHFMVTTDNKAHLASTLDIGTLEINTEYSFFQQARTIEICSSRAFCHPLPSNRVSVLGFSNKLNKNPVRAENVDMVESGMQVHVTYPLDLDFDLTRIGLHPAGHAAISWPSKSTEGNTVGVPRGLSGAPVWCMPHSPDIIESASYAVMAGVFIEYRKSHKIAIYTRASQLTRFIDQTYFTSN
jgi:hypothetical protein